MLKTTRMFLIVDPPQKCPFHDFCLEKRTTMSEAGRRRLMSVLSLKLLGNSRGMTALSVH